MDGLTATNKLGAATYFITVTCNPNWEEILECLKPGEMPVDHPNIVVHVFKQKFDAIIEEIMKHHVLGLCMGYSAVIEFGKKEAFHMDIS